MLALPKPMLKAIFFDAVGTLFYLTKTVGDHYAIVAAEVGLKLNAKKLDAAFYSAWKQMPPREAIDGPRENDDKDWWRELVDLVLKEAAPTIDELDRDNFLKSLTSISPKPACGNRIRKSLTFWSNCDRTLRWRSFQISTADCASFLNGLASRNISATFSSQARSARTNPIRKFFGARSNFLRSNRATLCMLAMIPSAIGGPRPTPACRFFN